MVETNDFYNEGFGWICRHCNPPTAASSGTTQGQSRLMREGEGESRWPLFSTAGLAKWADPAHRILTCPACGITEQADKR